MRLPDLLDASAARRPHAPAITDVAGGRTLDYGEVAALARRGAEHLTGAGVRPGARIGLIAGNTLECVPIAFGIMAAGGCLVPMAPTLRRAEVDAIIAATDLNAIVRVDGGAPAMEMLDPERRPPDGFVELEPAVLRFTSGTTASSKGVILSHRDVLERVAAADSVLRLSADDRVMWTLPLAYHFAVTIVGYIRAGAHILLVNDALPAALVEAASRQRASVLYGSPLQFERMVGSGALRPLPDVRVALSTAAALPAAVAPEFEAAFGVPLGRPTESSRPGCRASIRASTTPARAASAGRSRAMPSRCSTTTVASWRPTPSARSACAVAACSAATIGPGHRAPLP